MKKRNTTTWLARAVAVALTICCATVGAQPTALADATLSKTSREEIAWDSPKYFTNEDGTIFEFFEIYNVEEGEELSKSMIGRELPKGVICRRYEGDPPSYVQQYADMDKWDTDGTFTFNGEDYQYNLVAPSALTREHREIVEKTLVHILPTNPEKLAYFDYSKDGRLLVNDLVLLNKRLMYNPLNSVTNCDLVMYDEMDKDTFFKILNYWNEQDEPLIYIMYGYRIPSGATSTTTTTTTTSTTTVTTTTATEADGITWNTGVAKDVAGNDVTWYEVQTNESGEFLIPSEATIASGDNKELSEARVVVDTYRCVNSLLELPKKMGVDADSFKLVVSEEPICYSWVTTQFAYLGIADSLYQICPSSDIDRFNYIFADSNNSTVINTSNLSDTIMWCPGEWMNFHPWLDNENDIMEVDGHLTDMVIDLSGKNNYIFNKYKNYGYLSMIPNTDIISYEFGSGIVSPYSD